MPQAGLWHPRAGARLAALAPSSHGAPGRAPQAPHRRSRAPHTPRRPGGRCRAGRAAGPAVPYRREPKAPQARSSGGSAWRETPRAHRVRAGGGARRAGSDHPSASRSRPRAASRLRRRGESGTAAPRHRPPPARAAAPPPRGEGTYEHPPCPVPPPRRGAAASPRGKAQGRGRGGRGLPEGAGRPGRGSFCARAWAVLLRVPGAPGSGTAVLSGAFPPRPNLRSQPIPETDGCQAVE